MVWPSVATPHVATPMAESVSGDAGVVYGSLMVLGAEPAHATATAVASTAPTSFVDAWMLDMGAISA